MRNKKNHYMELTPDAREVFGRIPDEFVVYWTIRFPRLLLHTWMSLHSFKTEPIFNKYYAPDYTYQKVTC